jgi:hypothetical protein
MANPAPGLFSARLGRLLFLVTEDISMGFVNVDRVPINKFASEVGVNASTAWRWALKGVRGHRLETSIVGGRRFVTRAQWEAFEAALNGKTAPSTAPSTGRQRTKQIQQARAEIEASGISC